MLLKSEWIKLLVGATSASFAIAPLASVKICARILILACARSKYSSPVGGTTNSSGESAESSELIGLNSYN